jgi:hypothetical protein
MITLDLSAGTGGYLYLRVDDSFKPADSVDLALEVEYVDLAAGALRVEFDGSDRSAPFSGAYSSAGPAHRLRGTGRKVSNRFRLPGAVLAGGQNGGADLRLCLEGTAIGIHTVRVERILGRDRNP